MGNHYNCIYMYTNLINGNRYVGKAKDFNKRHNQHLKRKKHLIDKKIKEYGFENFKVEILIENVESNDKLNEYEKFFIKRKRSHVSYGTGYNQTWGGDGGDTLSGMTEEQYEIYSRKRRESARNEETRRKQSEARKGKPLSKETKQKLSEAFSGEKNPFYGCKHTKEARAQMSEKAKGRKHTEIQNQQHSERMLGEKNPFYGKQHTKETKQKLSEVKKVKVICIETKQVFSCIKDANKWAGITGGISKCCKGKQPYAGKHPLTNEKLHWMFYEDYLKLQEQQNNTDTDNQVA